MQRTKTQGFTLVELMVVISLIAFLAAAVFTSINDSRAVARDTKRVADMEAIEQALFLFRQANGRHPNESIDGVSNTGQMIGVGNAIDTALAPYLSEVPRDPIHDAGTGEAPAAGSLYFYSYDPQHQAQASPCPPAAYTGRDATVFGFNKSEARGVIRRETCHGGEMGLDQADYNKVLYPMAP